MKKLRVGIVGCGTIFKHHYAFINSCKRCEIVGVAETNTEIQKKNKKRI